MTTIEKIREAINHNQPQELKKILNTISSEELIQYNQFDRNKLLFISAKHRSKEMVSMLLDKGININTINKQGETVLLQLSKHSPNKIDHEFTLFLLEKGSNPNIKDEQNRSALFFMLAKINSVNELEEIKKTTQYALDFNLKDSKENNLLHFTIFHNPKALDLIDYLTFKGVSINEVNQNQENALNLAVLKSNENVVAKLIKQYHLKPNSQDVINSLNLGKDEVLVELVNSKTLNLVELNEKDYLMYNCLCFNMRKSLEAIKDLSNNGIWTETNVEKALEQYRFQFDNIFEIDEDTVNPALEFLKVSLVYFEKEKLESALTNSELMDSKKAKI